MCCVTSSSSRTRRELTPESLSLSLSLQITKQQLQQTKDRFQAFLNGDTQIVADEAFINAVQSYTEVPPTFRQTGHAPCVATACFFPAAPPPPLSLRRADDRVLKWWRRLFHRPDYESQSAADTAVSSTSSCAAAAAAHSGEEMRDKNVQSHIAVTVV